MSGNVGVGTWIQRRARAFPDDEALITAEGSLTYGQLSDRIGRLSAGLKGLGVTPGERVSWVGPNHPAFLETLFATGSIGGVLAPVNHRLPEQSVGAVLTDVEPTVVIRNDGTGVPSMSNAPGHVVEVGPPSGDGIPYGSLLEEGRSDPQDLEVGLEDLFLLAHTSGTTGRPKAIMLTHGNVTWNAVNMVITADLGRSDVTIAVAPFFRTGGTGVNVLPILYAGGAVVVPGAPSPGAILRLTAQHAATVGFANPDSLDALLGSEEWAGADLSSLRFVITGGAPVPERLIRAYLDRKIPVLQGYGLSEAAPVVMLLDPGDSLERAGSAGKPVMYVDVRVVDDEGYSVEAGATGELMVRGPNVMAGYWRDPMATAEVLSDDGWLRSGDAARVDEEGFYWIVDRLRDRFVVDGDLVYPGDVERTLLAMPGVAEAAATRVHEEAAGDRVGVLVVARDSSLSKDDILAACAARLPASHQPARVRFVESLPRTSVGKLIRPELGPLLEAG